MSLYHERLDACGAIGFVDMAPASINGNEMVIVFVSRETLHAGRLSSASALWSMTTVTGVCIKQAVIRKLGGLQPASDAA